MKDAARPRRKNHLPRLVPIEAVNDTDSMLAAYDERMRGAAGFVAEEPETVLIGLAGDLATAAPRDHAGPGSAHTGSAGGCASSMRDGAGSQRRLAPPPTGKNIRPYRHNGKQRPRR